MGDRLRVKSASVYQKFYISGSTNEMIRNKAELMQKEFATYQNKTIAFSYPHDLYHLGPEIENAAQSTNLAKNSRGFRYVLAATQKDQHIYLTLSLLDLNKKKIHCHIMLNSWLKKEYYDYINLRIDSKNQDAALGKNIKRISPPLLDASVQLQINKGDGNCALYTFEFVKALYKTLDADDNLCQQLEALSVEDANNLANKWQQVMPQLQQAVKKNLPQYYEKASSDDYQPKKYEQIKLYHMQQRWNIGRDFILQQHQQAKEQFKATCAALKPLFDKSNKVDVGASASEKQYQSEWNSKAKNKENESLLQNAMYQCAWRAESKLNKYSEQRNQRFFCNRSRDNWTYKKGKQSATREYAMKLLVQKFSSGKTLQNKKDIQQQVDAIQSAVEKMECFKTGWVSKQLRKQNSKTNWFNKWLCRRGCKNYSLSLQGVLQEIKSDFETNVEPKLTF